MAKWLKVIFYILFFVVGVDVYAQWGTYSSNQNQYTGPAMSVDQFRQEMGMPEVEVQSPWYVNVWNSVKSFVNDYVFQPISDFIGKVFFARSVEQQYSVPDIGDYSGRIVLDKNSDVYAIGNETVLTVSKEDLPFMADDGKTYRTGEFVYNKSDDSYKLKGEGRLATESEVSLGKMISAAKESGNKEWELALRSDYSAAYNASDKVNVISETGSNDLSFDINRYSMKYENLQKQDMVLYVATDQQRILRAQKNVDDNTRTSWLCFENNKMSNVTQLSLKPSERPLTDTERQVLTSTLNRADVLRTQDKRTEALKIEQDAVDKFGTYHVVEAKGQMTIAKQGELVKNNPAEWSVIIDYETPIEGLNQFRRIVSSPNDGYPNFRSGTFYEVSSFVSLTHENPVAAYAYEKLGSSGLKTTNLPEGYVVKNPTTSTYIFNKMASVFKTERVGCVKPELKVKRINAEVKRYED